MFWGTPILQFVPWYSWAWRTLVIGNLPLWNPLNGMGAPLLANYQSALFYPPSWLTLVLFLLGDVPLLAWGQALLIVFHLIWAGIGTALLAKRLNIQVLGQTISGLAFGLSGYLVARAGFLSITLSAAWLPWIMLAVLTQIQRDAEHNQERKPFFMTFPFGLILAITMQLLAGHAQTSWYTLVLGGAWTVFLGFRYTIQETGWGKWTKVFRVAGKYLLACIVAGMLASIQLIPTAEYLLQSQRENGLDPGFAMTYSFSPWRLITLLAPDFFGNPRAGNFWGYANYWEDAVYIGLLTVYLAGWAFFSTRRSKKPTINAQTFEPSRLPTIIFLVAITVVSFILALGKNTPIFPWLYKNIPTFDMFLAPTRYTLWATFSLALLAGYGADAWRRPTGWGLYFTRLAVAGSFAIIFGALLTPYFATQARQTSITASVLTGFFAAGILILTLRAPETEAGTARPAWIWAVIFLLSLDLMIAYFNINPPGSIQLYNPKNPAADELKVQLGGHRLYISETDEYPLKFERFFRFDTYSPEETWNNLRSVFLPNTNIFDEFPSVNNFDPLIPTRYARWMKMVNEAESTARTNLLSLMDVGLVEQVAPDKPYVVEFAKNPHPERFRWVPCAVQSKDPEEAWELVQEAASQDQYFQHYVILENQPSESNINCTDSGNQADITMLSENPNSISLKINAPQEGWLVVSDVWYPGWNARVDGVPHPILRANYLFRAVHIPAGEHLITFGYTPASFILGTLTTLGMAVGVFVLYYLQRGVSKPRPISSGRTTLESS